jgi:hypothetical protein
MPDSWRDILERAGENLSIDLNQERHSRIRQQSAGWPEARRTAHQPFSLPDLLEREREGRTPGRRQARQSPSRPSKARADRLSTPKARKKGRWGGLAPAAISVGIVALTIFGIYSLLH